MIVKEKENEIVKVEEKKDKISKRDVSIELIRIVSCLTVLGMHMSLQVLNQCYNRIDWSRLLQKCFLTDGVPMFFMITGFFIVNGRSYKKIWKSAINKVLIPAFIFVILTQIFYPFIVNQQTFLECLKNFDIGIVGIINCILKADIQYLNDTCAHLWYIFSHVKILIWTPILWLICKETDEAKLARRIAIGVTVLSTILVDIQRFYVLPVIGEFTILTIIPREILYVLMGYDIYVHKDKIKNNKKITIITFIGFVLFNYLRYKIEIKYMVLNSLTDIVGRDNFLVWKYTSLSIFSGVCTFMCLYSIEIKNEKLCKILTWIGDKTFGIYLIHYLIIAKVDLYKFEKIEKFYLEILYLVVGVTITFILSIIITCILRKIKELFINCYKKIFSTNE